MSRMLRTDWLFRQGKSQAKKTEAKRTLSCEPLEDRRVLATMVGTEADLRTALANGDACIELTSSITLAGGELAVTQAVEIDGGGNTIDGNGGGRVFNINDGDGYIDSFAVTIEDLTITGGAVVDGAGGGILTVEETTLNNVTVTGNSVTTPGGNTFSNMDVTTATGGGISTVGSTTINSSLISGNTASATGSVYYDDGMGNTANYIDTTGGGINAGGVGSLTINDSTVSGNSTTTVGGLIAFGGGIDTDGDSGTTLNNTDVTGNFSGYNGGGLRLGGEGPISITGGNISNNIAGDGFDGVAPDGGGISVSGATNVDITITDATIDSNSVVAEASTGNVFPYGAGIAMVFGSGSLTLSGTDITNNVIDGTGVTAAGTNAVSRGAGIMVRGDTTGVTPLGRIDFSMTDGLLTGNEALDGTATNNGASFGGNFHSSGGVDISLDNVTSSGGNAAVGGGFGTLHFNGLNDVTIANSTFSGNSADIGGGLATWRNTISNVTNTTVSGNTAISYGGGWLNIGASNANPDQNGDLYIDRSTISGNVSYGTSAGFHLTSGGLTYAVARPNNVVISNSTISGNNASANGGAFYVYDSNVTINQSTVSGNSSLGVGGAFYGQIACDTTAGDTVPCYVGESVEAVFLLNQSTFANNYSGSGGAIQVGDNTGISITNSLLTDNQDGLGAAASDFAGGGGTGNPDTGATATVAIDYSWVAGDSNGNAGSASGTGNVIGTGNAGIGALADNGGPTETHALMSTSSALDVADPAVTGGTDQRGFGPRDTNGRADMGAYEFDAEFVQPGDFNGDGMADCVDINMLSQDVAAASNTAAFDLNGDTVVDAADIDEWLSITGNTQGDANLDGTTDGDDFDIWSANKFTANANWCDGDFNGDGGIDGHDFLLWNANKTVAPPSIVDSSFADGKLDVGQRSSQSNSGAFKSGESVHEFSRSGNLADLREARGGAQAQRIRVAGPSTPIAAPAAVSFSASDVVASEVKNSTAAFAGTDSLEAKEAAQVETAGPALRVQAVNRFDSIANHDDAEETAVDSLFASLGSEL